MRQRDHDDHAEYFHFTGKARLEVAAQTLHGLLEGVGADGRVSDEEVGQLVSWASRHREFAHHHPFNELIPKINEIVADGIVDEEELADLLWISKRLQPGASYYDNVTAELQELHGFLAGVIADGVITTDEIESLGAWIDGHEHLRTCWPYDEIDSLITSVMADGKIDEDEQQQLLAFFGKFSKTASQEVVSQDETPLVVGGVCAACPEVMFEDRLFCLTGSSTKGPREYLVEVIESRGGRFNRGLRKDTDYLVVGADGNPCWAYSCYGRKIEDAMRRRREGQKVVIVHEYDFWDEVGE